MFRLPLFFKVLNISVIISTNITEISPRTNSLDAILNIILIQLACLCVNATLNSNNLNSNDFNSVNLTLYGT